MKERALTVSLALALCLALTVPAFAAGADRYPLPEAAVALPGGSDAAEETAAYQILHITGGGSADGGDALVYAEEPVSEELTVTALPLGASVTIGPIARLADGETCHVRLSACSDPDGDGVYEERVFWWEANTAYNTTDYSLRPLTERGPFVPPEHGACGYVTEVEARDVGFQREDGDGGSDYALTAASDTLHELFGADTLIRIAAWWDGGEPEELVCLLLTGEGAAAPAFTDVAEDAYYAGPVKWALESGITTGTTPTTFSPSRDCTHAQILTFLWRAAGEPVSSAKAPIAVAAAYAEAVNWAYGKGMIGGSFDPDAPCTRSEAVLYIWWDLDRPSAEDSSFDDVPADAPYAKAVSWAVAAGVTDGYGGSSFAPDVACTRGQIVTFLYRASGWGQGED